MYSSFRFVRSLISGGIRVDFPEIYKSCVFRSANDLIMQGSVKRHVTLVNAKASSTLLRGIPEGPQDRVDASLIPRPLGFEPLQHISVDAQRHRGLGGEGFQTT